MSADTPRPIETPAPQKQAEKPDAKDGDLLVLDGLEIDKGTLDELRQVEAQRAEGAPENKGYASFEDPQPPEKLESTREDSEDGGGSTVRVIMAPGAPKRYFNVSHWEKPPPSKDDVRIRGLTSSDEGVLAKLNQEARKDPDPHTHGTLPQVDGGQGGHALAEAYSQRYADLQAEHAAWQEKQEKQANKPEAPSRRLRHKDRKEQPEETPPPPIPEKPAVCIVNSDNGKSLCDMIEATKTADPDLHDATRWVAAFTDQRQLDNVRNSGIFKDYKVDFHLMDPEKPELPEGTVAAMVNGLDQFTPHRLVNNPNLGNVGERQEIGQVRRRDPIFHFDPETGKAAAIEPANIKTFNSTEAGVEKLLPHVGRRIGVEDIVTVPENQTTNQPGPHEDPLYTISLGEDLKGKESIAYNFMEGKPAAWTFNCAPKISTFMESITGSAADKALILIEATPLRDEAQVLSEPEEIADYLADPSAHRPSDSVFRDESGNVVQVSLPGRYSKESAEKWEGYITPDENNFIADRRGPLIQYVVEGDLVRDGVAKACPHAEVLGSEGAPGQSGYMLIDLSEKPEQVASAQTAFCDDLEETATITENFTVSMVDDDLTETARKGWDKDLAAQRLEGEYMRAAKNPQVARDYGLALDLAEVFYRHGMPDHARVHALRASQLMPGASTPHVLVAKTYLEESREEFDLSKANPLASATPEQVQAALDKLAPLQEALEPARPLSPHNGEIYETGSEAAKWQLDLYAKAQQLGLPLTRSQYQEGLNSYVDHMKHFLAHAEMLPQDAARNLLSLSTALRQDWQLNQNDNSVFKTVLAHNTVTNERTFHEITVAEMKQVITAEAIESAWTAAEMLLDAARKENPEAVTNELRYAITEGIMQEWERVRPRSDSELIDPDHPELGYKPLPPEEWATFPPADQPVRWLFEGQLYQSDEQVPPGDLSELLNPEVPLANPLLDPNAVIEKPKEEKVPQGPEIENDHDIALGMVLDSVGRIDGNPISIPVDAFPANTLVVGKTGAGKTSAINVLLEGCHDAGVKFLVLECGSKEDDFADAEVRLEGQADVLYLKPGLDQLSFFLFEPEDGPSETEVRRVGDAIDIICDSWEMAYDMHDPFISLLRTSLMDAYAANGWNVGHADHPSSGMGQTVPTSDQVYEFLAVRIAKYNQSQGQKSDAGATIEGFFASRKADQDAFTKPVTEDGEPVDLVETIENNNVVMSLAHFGRDEDRAFLAAIILKKGAGGLMRKRGSKVRGLRNIIVLEEARQLLKPAAEGDKAGKARVAALSKLMLQQRASGIGTVISTQSLRIDRDFWEQANISIVGSLQGEDRNTIVDSLDPGNTELSNQIKSLEPGQVMVSVGGARPIRVQTMYDQKREDAIKEATPASFARKRVVPIKMESKLRREVAKEVSEPEQAWARIFGTAIVLGQVASSSMRLPQKVPKDLQKEWNRAKAKGPEHARKARMRLETIIGRTVNDRIEGQSLQFDPAELAKSSLSIAINLLEGKRAGVISDKFAVDQIKWAAAHAAIVSPNRTRAVDKKSYALPLANGVPGFSERVGERVADRVKRLRQHKLSPVMHERNRRIAWVSLFGKKKTTLWEDMRLVTGNNPNNEARWREVATQLGYCGLHDDKPSDWETTLTLASTIRSKDLYVAVA